MPTCFDIFAMHVSWEPYRFVVDLTCEKCGATCAFYVTNNDAAAPVWWAIGHRMRHLDTEAAQDRPRDSMMEGWAVEQKP